MALIERDELVEITPNAIRIRKETQLHEHERRRTARSAASRRRESA